MRKSRTINIQIQRPVDEVYAFLVDPRNLASWTMVENGRQVPDAGPLVWAFEAPRGDVLVHFTPPNAHFIMDYTVRMNGDIRQAGYVRLIGNGEGTEMIHTSIQQPEISDPEFESEAEWLTSDLLVLKSLLEAS